MKWLGRPSSFNLFDNPCLINWFYFWSWGVNLLSTNTYVCLKVKLCSKYSIPITPNSGLVNIFLFIVYLMYL